MKTKLMIIIMMMCFIILNASVVLAVPTYGVFFTISPNQIKPGETFSVTLSAQCDDGINGIDTTYTYDVDKLELVSAEVVDTKNWSSLGIDNQITVICNSTETITEADIYKLTFKVKEDIKPGDTATISTTDILLDSDAATDSEMMIEAKELTITVENVEEPEPPTNPDDDKDNNNNTIVDPGDDSQNEAQNNSGISAPGNIDNSIAPDKLPYTGIHMIMLVGIAVLIILAILLYKINKKYKNI